MTDAAGHPLAAPQKFECGAGIHHSHSCRFTAGTGRAHGAQSAFRALRRLIAGVGTLSRESLELRAVGGLHPEGSAFGVFARRPIQHGQVLVELPLRLVLWRETVDLASLGIHLRSGSLLSEAERLVLYLAVLRRQVAQSEASSIAFSDYVRVLLSVPIPNSTIFWSTDELAWLRGTEAGDLSEHFMSRISHIQAAAPQIVELEDLKRSFIQFMARHFRLWLGGSAFSPGHVEAVMLPGVDMCRAHEGGLQPFFDEARRAVLLVADRAIQAGEEIFVNLGMRDHTDEMVVAGRLGGEASGIFLPIPLHDANAGPKARLLEQLRWPAEVRLVGESVQSMRILRLAVMPPEEFSAWTVGALVAGAPIAVSRGFRTEVLAMLHLLSECSRRGAVVHMQLLDLSESVATTTDVGVARLQNAREYYKLLNYTFGQCKKRAHEKLMRLQKWAAQAHPGARAFIQERNWYRVMQELDATKQIPLLSQEPPEHFSASSDLDVRMSYTIIVSLVNSRAREFVPYFQELLQAPTVTVRGFTRQSQRLHKIKRLASSMVQLKGLACTSADLSAFDWINELRGEEDAFETLKYLLPEMDDLVEEFVQKRQGC